MDFPALVCASFRMHLGRLRNYISRVYLIYCAIATTMLNGCSENYHTFQGRAIPLNNPF